MRVNSVTFRFTFDDIDAIGKVREILGDDHLSIGNGTSIFVTGGQLAVQFFSPLAKPTPEQKAEFDRAFSSIKEMGDLLKGEEIK